MTSEGKALLELFCH